MKEKKHVLTVSERLSASKMTKIFLIWRLKYHPLGKYVAGAFYGLGDAHLCSMPLKNPCSLLKKASTKDLSVY